MNYETFCSQIIESDSKVRFASVYDQWAVRVAGGLREGLTSLLSEHAERELVNLSILDWKARKEVSKWLGKTKYVMSKYDKVKRFSFYLGDDHMLLMSTLTDMDTNTIVDTVIDLYYKNQD